MKLAIRLALLILVLAGPLAAQPAKKLIGKAEWDSWRSIQGATISNDGKWVAYTLSPGVGDGVFVVRSTTGTTEYRVPVGYIARPNTTPGGLRGAGAGAAAGGGGGGGGRGGRGGGGPVAGGPFTADSRHVFVTTQATKAVVDSVARAQPAGRGARGGRAGGGGAGGGNAQANPATRNVVKMITLADGKVTDLPEWRSYRLPRFNGRWVVYSASSDSAAAGADSAEAGGRGAPGGGGGRGAREGGAESGANRPRRTLGNAIMLRNLDTGADERLNDVVTYAFDDSAKVLVYVVGSRSDSTKDGVYVRNMANGQTAPLLSGPGNYRNVSFDRAQTQLVFSSDRDQFGRDSAQSTIYVASVKGGTAQPMITPAALPRGLRFTANGSATFNRAGTALTFGIQPPPESDIPADSLVGKPVFDLWHWKDPQIQTVQKLQVNQARNRSYQAIFHLASRKFVQLTNDSIANVSLSDDGTRGVANSSFPYRIESMWGDGGNDVYVVDPMTGSKKLIRTKIDGNAQLSLGARYAIFFNEGDWFTYDLATGKETNITDAIKNVHFDQETWNRPSTPGSWGIAGWTRGDSTVLLYDRTDIWQVDPRGVRPPVMVTDSLGRRENITFRIVDLEPDEERAIDASKPFYLSAFDEDSKQSGFYRDQIGVKRAPEKIAMADLRYGTPEKARNTDMWMVTKSTFVEFPNLYVGPNFTQLTKISDANPQQAEYNWGTAELVTWLSMDGDTLQGILYKPENFDPSRKYPMVSYFYEELSDGLHGYIAPAGRSSINVTTYVSNGYLVFEPDITYDMGLPGPSAVKSIIPGVQMLLARGYVDQKGLGLQGHSWGGYQTAYLITQTTMFSGAEAGAPVANMTSAYGGIRWGSGINRSTQYERGQSRIGKSIWEAPNLYIENSPLFYLDRVTTPLLILHDDMDDAVPWYQGIELYVGMRRNGKEVYLFNYNNELHSPAARQNQQDFAIRTMQFFDATLKKRPAPDWMVNGIPAKDKGREFVTPPPVIRP